MGKKGKKALKKAALIKELKANNASSTQKFGMIKDKLAAVKHIGYRIRESSSPEEEWRLFMELVEQMEGVDRLQGAPEGGNMVDAGDATLNEFEEWLQKKGVIGAGVAWIVRETEGGSEEVRSAWYAEGWAAVLDFIIDVMVALFSLQAPWVDVAYVDSCCMEEPPRGCSRKRDAPATPLPCWVNTARKGSNERGPAAEAGTSRFVERENEPAPC